MLSYQSYCDLKKVGQDETRCCLTCVEACAEKEVIAYYQHLQIRAVRVDCPHIRRKYGRLRPTHKTFFVPNQTEMAIEQEREAVNV